MSSQHLIDQLRNLALQTEQRINDLSDLVSTHPDNPDILERKSAGAFILSSKSLAGNVPWSVFYHDFKAQQKEIARLIVEKKVGPLNTILDKGVLYGPDRNKENFNPVVIAAARPQIEEAIRLISAWRLGSDDHPSPS